MSTPRALGVFLCLLGFAAVCVMAFVSTLPQPFAGLRGIQDDITSDARQIVLTDLGLGLEGDAEARVIIEGRDLTVDLPETALAGFDRDALQGKLEAIDGVRSVELRGDPALPVDVADAPDPVPTEAPADDPEPTAEPTREPTAEPAPEPTAEPLPAPTEEPTTVPTQEPTTVPTEEPTEEPTTAPTPEPTEAPAEPTLAEVVEGIDLGAVQFEPGTARLSAQDTAVLDAVADALQGQTEGRVQVQAHTSNRGDPDVNLLLSQDRADAIVAYLIDRGVEPSLLSARGFGSIAPIADNSTEQGRAANQRVVLVVEGN